MPGIEAFLRGHMQPAAPALVEREGEALRCRACANRCLIVEGGSGVCGVRFNVGGELLVPGGYVAGLQMDPIEKKPFFHVFPGRGALSFGMLSCNFHCPFCQNWSSSQVTREPLPVGRPRVCTAEEIVGFAVEGGAPVIVSTYNEPLITSDWAGCIFGLAKGRGLRCGYVSNGHATPEVLSFLRPVMDMYKVDLKCFDEERYRALGGSLKVVCGTIGRLLELGFWVEVVTLVIPSFNDSRGELLGIARFLAGLSRDIPWHVTGFHPDYRMVDRPWTGTGSLDRAYEAGREAGLRFVYAGNCPGGVGNRENTYCPGCGALLVERCGFRVKVNRVVDGQCPQCHERIPGLWG